MNKKCSSCKIKKKKEFFSKSSGTKDKLQYVCKVCQVKQKREYYKKNPSKLWFNKNPDVAISRANKYKQENWERMMLLCSKNNARKFGRDFSIELEDIIIPEVCPLLGIKLTRILGSGRVGSNPSLDRIDNKKGYIKGNVMVISEKANRIKMNLTIEELKLLSKNINKLYVI